MNRKREIESKSRVFIAGFQSFEIVFLPGTVEITSWMEATGPVPDAVQSREGSPEAKDNLGWE